MGGSNSASKYGQLRYQICWLLDDLVICVFTSTLPCLLLLTEYGSYSYWSLELLSPSPPPSPPPPPWLASVGLVPFRRSLSGRVLPSPASPAGLPRPSRSPLSLVPAPQPPSSDPRLPPAPLYLVYFCTFPYTCNCRNPFGCSCPYGVSLALYCFPIAPL